MTTSEKIMRTPTTHARHLQRAFSLVEIMVGMVIGMLGIVIIMQMTTLFESRKRTTTGGDDAQNGGAIALYSLQSQISQAGYGISSSNLIGKSLATPFTTINALTPVVVNLPAIAGVQDANTDSFVVLYGNSHTTSEGSLINNSAATLPYQIVDGTGSGAAGEGGKSFSIGDWVIPSQSGVTASHGMFQVIGPSSTSVVAVSGVPPSLAYVANASNPPFLFNLGPSPSIAAYAIINGALNTCDYLNNNCATTPAAWTRLADGIINMRVQCNASNGLRVALIARSVQIDPNIVTTVTPYWNPAGISAPVVATPAAAWGADWNKYRYKTFETIVPIRNAIWSGVQGC